MARGGEGERGEGETACPKGREHAKEVVMVREESLRRRPHANEEKERSMISLRKW